MRTPAKQTDTVSAVCEQNCTTPTIIREATRGQDVASPQDVQSVAHVMDEVRTAKQTSSCNGKGAHVATSSMDETVDDIKFKSATSKRSSTSLTSSVGRSVKTSRLDVGDEMKSTAAAAANPDKHTTAVAVSASPTDIKAVSSSALAQHIFRDNYTLKQHLSKTLYGNIFTCSDKRSNKAFACKVISNARVTRRRRSNLASDDPATEFRVLQLLRDHPHRNLLSLVDKFQDDKKVYFVMPLANGGDLLASVERHSNGLGDSLTRDILKQLVEALQHLHNMGWQHGDVSLENILLMSPGDFSCVKLCDFGLAGRMGSPGRSVGKSMYMSPEELATGNMYSSSTPTKFSTSAAQDIFSLGVSMFITLFGFPPFDVAQDTDINYRTLTIDKEKYFGNLKKWGVPECKVRLPIVALFINMMNKDATKRPTLINILDFLTTS